MYEANYQLGIKVAANMSMIHRNGVQGPMHSQHEHRGLVMDVIAGLGSVLVRLGTTMERFALVDEKIHADA